MRVVTKRGKPACLLQDECRTLESRQIVGLYVSVSCIITRQPFSLSRTCLLLPAAHDASHSSAIGRTLSHAWSQNRIRGVVQKDRRAASGFGIAPSLRATALWQHRKTYQSQTSRQQRTVVLIADNFENCLHRLYTWHSPYQSANNVTSTSSVGFHAFLMRHCCMVKSVSSASQQQRRKPSQPIEL